jgi:hypothetical protein
MAKLSIKFTIPTFLDDLIKTCSWNILYFIPYTLMIKFTTCFPMVGGCPGTREIVCTNSV